MKSILLIRHAKSSWDFDVEDFDRPLNERGKTDAPAMAERLRKRDFKIDAFLSSPATRALATANIFASEFNEKQKNVITFPALYEPTPEAFTNLIEGLDKDLKNVAIFSHNPGITDFANSLTTVTVDDMPTCAIFALKADIKKWAEFNASQKTFWFFDYPKA
jgi:phosphohistidine phosphatase